MLSELVIVCTFSIISSLAQYLESQYYDNMPQNYYSRHSHEGYDYEEDQDYSLRHPRPQSYTRDGHRKERDEDYSDETDFEDCKCSCTRCKTNPDKPCCFEVCKTCEQMRQQLEPAFPPVAPPQSQGVLFVPYPYPLMMPQNAARTEAIITTTALTTTTETDKPREKMKKEKGLTKSLDETILFSGKNPLKSERRYMLTTVRKTKPAYEPKYGIVPIPDTLAEKLMNQLKQNKDRNI